MTSDKSERVVARRYRVTGRVQGVFFRASTRETALGLNMTGRAINLADGRVEVIASGTEYAHRALLDWLHEGPPAASVTAVDVEAWPSADEGDFVTG